MLHAPRTIATFHHIGYQHRVIGRYAIHVCIFRVEVVIRGTALQGNDIGRHLLGAVAYLVSVEGGGVLLVSDITYGGGEVVVVCFDDTAILAGECALALGIRTLHGRHHRFGASTVVVAFYKCRRAHRYAYAIFRVTIEIVVEDMYRHGTYARVARVGVVEPVVVVGDIVRTGL